MALRVESTRFPGFLSGSFVLALREKGPWLGLVAGK
jgi:hypothetical protein